MTSYIDIECELQKRKEQVDSVRGTEHDKIAMYKGKYIKDMDRTEPLDLVNFLGKHIKFLEESRKAALDVWRY